VRDVPATGLGLLLREAYRAFSREFYAHLALHGLTHAQWLHLWLLARAGSLTPGELSQRVGIKKASSTAVIDELARRRLIRRDPDRADRRKVNLSLTATGEVLMRKLLAAARLTNAHARAGIPDADMLKVFAVLRRLIENMERQTGGAEEDEPVVQRTSCR